MDTIFSVYIEECFLKSHQNHLECLEEKKAYFCALSQTFWPLLGWGPGFCI